MNADYEDISAGFGEDETNSGYNNAADFSTGDDLGQSWEILDFYGTSVLCEESSNGSLVSSVIVNDTFFIPDNRYLNWCIDDGDSDEQPLGVYVASFFVPAIGILSNIIICLVMARRRRFKKNFSNFHIFHLALVDLFLRCIFVAVVMDVSGNSFRNDWSCKLLCFIDFTTLAMTFTLLAGVAVDRYLNICYPFRARLLTWRHSAKVILISWLYSMLMSSPLTISRRYGDPLEQLPKFYQNWSSMELDEEQKDQYRHCYFSRGFYLEFFSTLYFLFVFILPLLSIITSYGLVIKLLWRRSRNHMINGTIARSKLKVIKMLILVVVVYLFSWGPFLVIHLLRSYNVGMYSIYYLLYSTLEEEANALIMTDLLDDISLIASCTSAVANPLIFAFYSCNFRSEVQNMLCCLCGSSRSRCKEKEKKSVNRKFQLKSFKDKPLRTNQKTYDFEKQLQFSKVCQTKGTYTLKSNQTMHTTGRAVRKLIWREYWVITHSYLNTQCVLDTMIVLTGSRSHSPCVFPRGGKASDQCTEVHGFDFHLELGFFLRALSLHFIFNNYSPKWT